MNDAWIFDPRSGNIQGNYEVRIDGDDIVFKFDRSGIEATVRKIDEDPDAIVKLTNILRPSQQHEAWPETPILIACADRADRIPIPDPAATENSYALGDERDLVAAAEAIGPLFGPPTANDTFPIIRESIAAWTCAARALSIAVKCKELVRDNKRSAILDREVSFHYIQSIDTATGFAYRASVALPILKGASPRERSALMCGINERRMDTSLSYDRPQPGTSCIASWSARSDRGGGLVLSVLGRSSDLDQPGILFQVNGSFVAGLGDAGVSDDGSQLNTEQSLLDNLAQAMAVLFLRGAGLDWSIVSEQGGRGTCLDLAFESALQRLWYSFGRRYSVDRIRTCEHCGRLFAAHDGRGGNKRYCNKTCQNNAKSARQRKRKAEADRGRQGTQNQTDPARESQWGNRPADEKCDASDESARGTGPKCAADQKAQSKRLGGNEGHRQGTSRRNTSSPAEPPSPGTIGTSPNKNLHPRIIPERFLALVSAIARRNGMSAKDA